MIIYYLFTHKTGFTAISMHVLVQLILCVWRNVWLTSEWMRDTFFLLLLLLLLLFIIDISVKTFYVKIPALYGLQFHSVFVNVKTLHYSGVCSHARMLLKRSTFETKQKKSSRIQLELYFCVEINFKWFFILTNIQDFSINGKYFDFSFK